MENVFALLHNKTVQGVSAWLALLSAAFVWLGSLTPEWVGHLTWPQLILGGIVASLVTSFVLACTMLIGAYAFRLFKPVAQHTSPIELDYTPPSPVEAGLADLAGRLEAVESLARATNEQFGEKAAEWDSRFATTYDHIAEMRKLTRYVLDKARHDFGLQIRKNIEGAELSLQAIEDGERPATIRREMATQFDGIMETTEQLISRAYGLDPQEGRDAYTAKIMTDPACFVVEEGEPWANGTEKREFMLRKARLEHLEGVVAAADATPLEPSTWELLLKVCGDMKDP